MVYEKRLERLGPLNEKGWGVPAINNLAFRKARKKLEFVLPIDGHGHNNFRVAKALLRRRRGYGRRLGAVIR